MENIEFCNVPSSFVRAVRVGWTDAISALALPRQASSVQYYTAYHNNGLPFRNNTQRACIDSTCPRNLCTNPCLYHALLLPNSRRSPPFFLAVMTAVGTAAAILACSMASSSSWSFALVTLLAPLAE